MVTNNIISKRRNVLQKIRGVLLESKSPSKIAWLAWSVEYPNSIHRSNFTQLLTNLLETIKMAGADSVMQKIQVLYDKSNNQSTLRMFKEIAVMVNNSENPNKHSELENIRDVMQYVDDQLIRTGDEVTENR